MTSEDTWDDLRAPLCAEDSLITRLDNSCMETAEHGARTEFSLTLSLMRDMSSHITGNNRNLGFHRAVICCR